MNLRGPSQALAATTSAITATYARTSISYRAFQGPKLTVAVDVEGEEKFFPLDDVSAGITLAELKSYLEAETSIPPHRQMLFLDGKALRDDKQTLADVQAKDDDLLRLYIVTPERPQRWREANAPQEDAELFRLRALSEPQFMVQLRHHRPALAAAVHDQRQFREAWDQEQRARAEADAERERNIARLNADPFDVEAQTKIAEMIREGAVMRNLEKALEHTPEVFGRVNMLYIPVEVNDRPIKAFVDSGAQATIMSPSCAERCGILHLLDKRFAGMAIGIGTAKILGRVHSCDMKIGNFHMPCAFTVMEGKDVDLLLGLDMLKRHLACIDLGKNALIIQGQEIRFLDEADIPTSDRHNEDEPTVEGPSGMRTGAKTGALLPPPQEQSGSGPGTSAGPSTPPAAARAQQQRNQAAAGTSDAFPPTEIQKLLDLGFSRDEAVNALRQTGGNIDAAAALLFG